MTTKDIVANWFGNLGFYEGMTPSNKESAEDKLRGYLDACVQFGHLSIDDSTDLFNELTFKEPLNFEDDYYPDEEEQRMIRNNQG